MSRSGPRVALVGDLHGNRVAFAAVLADVRRAAPDAAVCLGDVALTGPEPAAAVELLAEQGWPTVMGNCDAWLLGDDADEEAGDDEDSQAIAAIDRWCREQLSGAHLDVLRRFEPLVRVGDELLCFHGTPRSATEVVEATTPEAEVEEMLAGHDARVYAGGHTHDPLVRGVAGGLLVNPGSVGLPFRRRRGGARPENPPWAEWAVVTLGDPGAVELRRTPVDVDAMLTAARRSGMPHTGWWQADWVR